MAPLPTGAEQTDETRDGTTSLVLLARTVPVVLVCYVLVDRAVETGLDGLGTTAEIVVEACLITLLTSASTWLAVLAPHDRRRRRAEAARRRADERRTRLQGFQARLGRALEMASTESACYDVLERALDAAVPRLRADVMLADSSEAHLRTATSGGGGEPRPPCDVTSPQACPAVRRAQPLVFPDSAALDACPHLHGRDASGAACLPVSVAGRSIGVLHATVPHPTVSGTGGPTAEEVETLSALADQAGSRIGMLRVLQQTSLQAATDPLTGLLNRRSLEGAVREHLARRTAFAVAMVDLDHFKQINDVHGHDTGDRALRLFARTLATTVRAEDVVSRYGGEEFVVVLPDRTAEQAAAALARVAEALARALVASNLPVFTASFGVADTTDAGSWEELVALADDALLAAKRSGRDRVVLSHGDRHRSGSV